jgi:hypothetical protein
LGPGSTQGALLRSFCPDQPLAPTASTKPVKILGGEPGLTSSTPIIGVSFQPTS